MYVGKITLSFKINFDKKNDKVDENGTPVNAGGHCFRLLLIYFVNEIGELYFFIHLILMHNLNYTIKELKHISND